MYRVPVLIVLTILTTGCVFNPAALLPAGPTQTPPPGTTAPPEPLQTPTVETRPEDPEPTGFLIFPYQFADAGNYTLQAGSEITITWKDPPSGAQKYEFILQGDEQNELVGTDRDASDGVQTTWLVPEDLSGVLVGIASWPAEGVHIASLPSSVYSNQAPPAGICTLANITIGAANVYPQPRSGGEPFATISPGDYHPVLEFTQDGWYRIDVRQAVLLDEDAENPQSGWVSIQSGVQLFGPCRDLSQ